ncbi:NADPH-dependent oxidoreductase [Paenibacillus donghaensis]|uniref:NADPH-dependent oxidoreductase n=1 Tax=Paenibacillus donghaensis TaxID=414771 RepID=A0A2Z2KMY0_9BACL|nr:NADPH-dependent oxidoreductase [Paenibacillus donghaensis]ASA23939.1 NADPH-dependent oxidoreductase [Paenibacillus donghaensis]
MNETLKLLKNHRSYRQYTEQPVEPEKLKAIIEAAQAAPSWVHGQQVSIIAVRSPQRRQQLAALSGNQQHVADAPVFLVFCMDFYRAKLACELEGQSFEAAADVDLLLVGAADVGIALANAVAAAESLGLGIIPIGGVRRNTGAVIELLQLPQYVFPVVGLCVGYPAGEVPQKPRLPLEAVYHEEQYDMQMSGQLAAYDQTFREFQEAQGLTARTWTSVIAHFYAANPQYGDAGRTLKQQGFTCGNL